MNSSVSNNPLHVAFSLLSIRGYSEKEMTARLQRRGYNDEAIQNTILYLVERGYLNDTALCRMLYEKYIAKKYGIKAISYKLFQRGFSGEVIHETLKDYNMDNEWQNAFTLLQKKGILKNINKQKIARYLLSRGFTMSTVQTIILKLEKE